MSKGIKPEDVLSEDENYTIVNNIKVRKGTIAAALKNASILSSQVSQDDKEEVIKALTELAPALIVVGMYEHVTWKNPEIQKIIDETVTKLQVEK